MNLDTVEKPTSTPITTTILAPHLTQSEPQEEVDETKEDRVEGEVDETIKQLIRLTKPKLLDYIWSNTTQTFWQQHGLAGSYKQILDKKSKPDLISLIKKILEVTDASIEIKHVVNNKNNKISHGSVIAILNDKVSESSAKIVGLGIVDKILIQEKIVFFKVLTPYLEIETDIVQEKNKIKVYEAKYFKTCELDKPKDYKLNIDGDNVLKKYGGDDRKIEQINTNNIVLVMGEGDPPRNAAIGLIHEGINPSAGGKYTGLKIRILTKYEGDDGNTYDTDVYMDLSLNDVKLITPDDILGEDFLLQPDRPQPSLVARVAAAMPSFFST
jgi:hypothetical protein